MLDTAFRRPWPTTAVALAVCLASAALCGCADGGAFDRAALEIEENLSEALANDLLAWSVALRDSDLPAVSRVLADRVRATPLPAFPEPRPLERWISQREFELDPAARTIEREEFLAGLTGWLDHFASIEDVRFKVKHAAFDRVAGDSGEAGLKFFIVGRERNGHREWVRGTADVAVSRDDGPWRIDAFSLTAVESRIAEVDLFSEVAFPAGVARMSPPFGVGRNQGFVSHGAAVADVDGDGLLDLAATGVERNFLFRNLGDGTFADVSEESLVGFAPAGSGALFFDYDNDSDPDLFLAAVGRQVLLENRRVPDGVLQFWDVSERAGVDVEAVGFSAVAADVNSDGLTDVYVCSYNRYGTVMPDSWHRASNGTPNRLFVNRGDGTFREEAAQRGVADSRWSYAAAFVDLDADGDQDLYVANDFGENAFYVNQEGTFADDAAAWGIVDPGFGMGVSFGDYDNDGDLDLHVTNMSSTAGNRILRKLYPEDHAIRKTLSKQAAGNSLYENRGDGRFQDVSPQAGSLSGGWAFGGGFVDFDNDGWEDLYTPNGFVSGQSMKDT